MTSKREKWIESQGAKCVSCGALDQLEVDHVDPGLKVHSTDKIWTLSAVERDAELAKCQVLCRKCHINKSATEKRSRAPRDHGLALGSIHEIAEIMGVSKQRVHQITNSSWFPVPLKRLKAGPVYDLDEVRAALRSRGRDL